MNVAVTHRHWFTSLWWHFGEYGDQTVHVHSCMGDAAEIERTFDDKPFFDETDCDWAVIGVGRSCGGRQTRHWSQSLGARLEASEVWDALATEEQG